MTRVVVLALGVLSAMASVPGCSPPTRRSGTADVPAIPRAVSGRTASGPAVDPATTGDEDGLAYFAGGCFWGVEHYMEQLEGVTSVESGYMGGHVQAPSYEDVSSATSGHFETVRVRFDPDRVSYEEVAKLFFEIHDPTQADGQGPDIGPEYRSVVFVSTPEQKRTVESLIAQLKTRGYDVVTELRTADRFWAAEAYHQDYYERTGRRPYCHRRVRRFEP
jgi:methionine-S-sulfoxide reductase